MFKKNLVSFINVCFDQSFCSWTVMRGFFALILIFTSLSSQAQLLRRQTLLNNNFTSENKSVKVAFFDADSTLRVSISGSVSANSPTDVMILPNIETKIAELVNAGYLVAIVSNQGGIKAGVVTQETADAALLYTIQLIQQKNQNARIQYYDYAEADDEFRKPNKGMALRLEKILNSRGLKLDWSQSFMVGDSAYKKGKDLRPDGKLGTHFSNSDRLFAENLNIPFYEPTDFFGWRAQGIDVFERASEVIEYQKNNHPNCRRLF